MIHFENPACQILHSSLLLMSHITEAFSNVYAVTEGNHAIWFRDEVQIMILLSECCQLHASSRCWLQKSAALFPYKLNSVILYLLGHFVDVECNNTLLLSVLHMWQGYLHYKHSAIIVRTLSVKLIESFMAVFQLSPLCLSSSSLFALLIRSCFLCWMILISTIMPSFAVFRSFILCFNMLNCKAVVPFE